jgi:hypothetical protein
MVKKHANAPYYMDPFIKGLDDLARKEPHNTAERLFGIIEKIFVNIDVQPKDFVVYIRSSDAIAAERLRSIYLTHLCQKIRNAQRDDTDG